MNSKDESSKGIIFRNISVRELLNLQVKEKNNIKI